MRRFPSTRWLLFLAVVLLPGVLLLGVTVRLSKQERALAQRLQREARQVAAARLGQSFLAYLERIRLQELAAPGETPEGVVVLRGRVREGRIVAPWDELAAARAAVDAASEGALREAERLEFGGDPSRAVQAYRDVLNRTPEAAAARLGLARSLERSGQEALAGAEYLALLGLGTEPRDEQGVPLALYAADRLARRDAASRDAVAARLERALVGPDPLSPMEVYMVRDVSRTLAAGDASWDGLRERAERAAARMDRLLALQHDAPALLGLARRTPAQGERSWLPYGDPLWLMASPAGAGGEDSVLVVVDAALALQAVSAGQALEGPLHTPSVRLSLTEGDPLNPALPGVRVVLAETPSVPGSRSGTIVLLLVPLVLGATAFTAYLLWRDVRRDLAAARLRSQFVSSVSHELKTPLTSIRMFAETLQRSGGDPERRREYLDTIVGETERLSRLISNVLDFSRLEEGGKDHRRDPLRLGDVARQAARAMAYPLARDSFALRVDSDDAVALRGDRDALTQAVLNLLGNAVKFSGDAREIDLTVSTENGHAVVRVTDRGMGVAPEERHRIFDDFYRSEEAERRGIPGTGLGLPLVRHVARAHGGDVEVESLPGAGSTFTLRLPLEEEP